MIDYGKIQQNISKLIKDFGTSVSIEKLQANNDQPWKSEIISVSQSLVLDAVFVNLSGEENLGFFGLTDDLLLRTDLVFLSFSQLNLENFDRVVYDNVTYKIIWVKKLSPSGLNLLYAFGIRK